ncbi:MAG: VanW family protein [Bacillota bacterium]
MRRTVVLVAAIVLVFGFATSAFALWTVEKTNVRPDIIVDGVRIGGIPFGGLTAAEAMAKLRACEAQMLSRPVRLECAGRTWPLPLERAGVRIDTEVLEKALAVGRRGWLVKRYLERRRVSRDGVDFPIKVRVDREKLTSLVAELTRELTVLPQDAGFKVLPDDTITVVPSRDGRCADAEAAYSQLLAILNKGGKPVVRVWLKEIPPNHTTGEILSMGLNCLLSEFTTTFDPTKANRVYNISVAAGALNGLLVKPREVVSFNEIVGPRSTETGYKTAPVILNNEFVDAVGGGVCQVATTLYNAVLLAGLETVERRNHSLPVNYVPAGRDATVVYGGSDFKFLNNTGRYLYLRTSVSRNHLTVKIYGNSNFKRRVEVRSWITKVLEPKVIRREDPNLEAGKIVVKQKGICGYQAKAERLIWDGKRVLREQLPSSSYHPLNEIIAVGTKVIPSVVSPQKPGEPETSMPQELPGERTGSAPQPSREEPRESTAGDVYEGFNQRLDTWLLEQVQ